MHPHDCSDVFVNRRPTCTHIEEHWRAEIPVVTNAAAPSRIARTQTGENLYKVVIADCLENCSRKALVVFDHFAGVGDTGIACLELIASSAHVHLPPLYYVGCEHRPVFYEVSLARIRSGIGEKYVSRQLRSATHPEPVPEPALLSPDEKRVKLSPATMSSRLKVLTVSPDGILMVPLLPEDTCQHGR